MCGVLAYIGRSLVDENLIMRLNDTQRHRGPDDSGVWIEKNIALAHRRLSIIDTSAHGRQPMSNEDKTVWLVLNGEIYNFKELKKNALQDRHEFVSDTDCEIVIHLYEEYGMRLLGLLEGMFAFCLVDLKINRMFACRDRIGIKPLYYGWNSGDLIVSSELKPFNILPHFSRRMHEEAMVQYLSLGYINAPLTIFSDVKKIRPAHYITVDLPIRNQDVKETQYWDVREFAYADRGRLEDVETAVSAVDDLMSDIVPKYLISDVPIGLFLSGGIDSSFVTSYIGKFSEIKPRCLSIGFEPKEYDEVGYAKIAAKRFGLEQDVKYLGIADMMNLPSPIELFDEPFADSSSYPTFMVSKLARERVKTILSGDGGDEFFAGYERYFRCYSTGKYNWVPKFAFALPRYFMSEFDYGYGFLSKLMAKFPGNYFDFVANFSGHQLRNILRPEFYDYYRSFRAELVEEYLKKPADVPPIRRFQVFDSLWYLPGDILVKVDRCSMHVSLEVRVPLLDHRLAELSFGISDSLKYDSIRGKIILVKMLSRYFDDDFLLRRKKGFNIPLNEWSRKQHLQQLYLNALPHVADFCNVEYLKKLVEFHNKGKRDFSNNMWSVSVLGNWVKRTHG